MRTAREVWECGEWRGRERERGKEAHYKRCAFSPMTESQNGKYLALTALRGGGDKFYLIFAVYIMYIYYCVCFALGKCFLPGSLYIRLKSFLSSVWSPTSSRRQLATVDDKTATLWTLEQASASVIPPFSLSLSLSLSLIFERPVMLFVLQLFLLTVCLRCRVQFSWTEKVVVMVTAVPVGILIITTVSCWCHVTLPFTAGTFAHNSMSNIL